MKSGPASQLVIGTRRFIGGSITKKSTATGTSWPEHCADHYVYRRWYGTSNYHHQQMHIGDILWLWHFPIEVVEHIGVTNVVDHPILHRPRIVNNRQTIYYHTIKDNRMDQEVLNVHNVVTIRRTHHHLEGIRNRLPHDAVAVVEVARRHINLR